MTNDKMTNKKALAYVLNNCDVPADVAEKLNGMIAQLEKRAGAERKPTARQLENAALKSAILAEMQADVLYTISQMIKEFDCIDSDTSTQRISPLMNQLVNEGKVVKTIDKRKTYFSLA